MDREMRDARAAGVPLQLVIFDCDGVLIDSERIAARTEASLLGELGFPLTVEELLARYVGLSASATRSAIERDFGRRMPDGYEDRIEEETLKAFERELEAMPGAASALAEIALPRCVVSGSSLDRVTGSLELTGLYREFEDRIFSAQMVSRGKPAPDLMLHAARRMGAAPEACLVVEDSEHGVTAARAAGMHVLGFSGGGHAGEGHARTLRGAGAHATFDDLRALPTLIRELDEVG